MNNEPTQEYWECYRKTHGWREYKAARRREYSRLNHIRRKETGFKNNSIITNIEKTEGFEKHHLLKTFVISLPSFIHREVPHGFDISNSGMEEENQIALNFLLGNW